MRREKRRRRDEGEEEKADHDRGEERGRRE